MEVASCIDPQVWTVISSCRPLDFSLYFEQLIFLILPSSLFILAFPFRILHLWPEDRKTESNSIIFQKLVSVEVKTQDWDVSNRVDKAIVTSVGILQTVNLALWCLYGSFQSPATIPGCALGVLSSVLLAFLSYAEHQRSVRPSTLITVYLVECTLYEAVQLRTLIIGGFPPALIAAIATTLALDLLLLVTESRNKGSHLSIPFKDLSRESKSSIFSRSTFWWLNRLLVSGHKSVLTVSHLISIDEALSSKRLRDDFYKTWGSRTKFGKNALLYSIFTCFRKPLLLAVIPRLCQSAFTFAQPFLINTVVSIASTNDAASKQDVAYALIIATALTYIGLAVAIANYKYRVYRMLTILRGTLVAIIFDKTLRLKTTAIQDNAALTLMSTDVERIAIGLQNMHEIWASIVDVGIAMYLLWRQIGAAFVTPIILAALCTAASSWVAKFTGSQQELWNDKVEKRVDVTSSMLVSTKAVRLTGWTDSLISLAQHLRIVELRSSKGLRYLWIAMNTLANTPSTLAPFLTLVVFKATHQDLPLTTASAFTTLSIVALMTSPLAFLLNSIPSFMAATGCFNRIQAYILREDHEDKRPAVHTVPHLPWPSIIDFSSTLEVVAGNSFIADDAVSQLSGRTLPQLQPSRMIVSDASFGYNTAIEPIVHGVSFELGSASLTIVVGSVGSGKTTLLKGLIGEIPLMSGHLACSKSIAYCSQDPWLQNTTIMNSIIQDSYWDEKWYLSVLKACGLEHDLDQLASRDMTVIGSGGGALSGGQKQRLSLARAVYSKRDVMLLDDILSGVDPNTAQAICINLFGPLGLIRKHGMSVLFATHSMHYIAFADQVLEVQPTGEIEQYTHAVAKAGKMSESSTLREAPDTQEERAPNVESSSSDRNQELARKTEDLLRKTGDFTVYAYYWNAMGSFQGILLIVDIIIFVVCLRFPQIWVSWWAAADTASPGSNIALYVGVYAALSSVALFAFASAIWVVYALIVPRAGRILHWRLLQTAMKATYTHIVKVDAGETVNRFSQDISLIDNELADGVFTTLMDIGICLAQAILLTLSSVYLAIAIPFCLVVLYFLQRYYLRTSRQLRLLDLEAKSPLYTSLLDMQSGLATIRAFGWQDRFREANLSLLDLSQRPFYLLYMCQRWLNLVLDMTVAGLAVLLVTFALILSNSSAGSTSIGVGLLSILTLGQNMSLLVQDWTMLETSLGAVARVKSFVASTPLEEEVAIDSNASVATNVSLSKRPSSGNLVFDNVTASYGDSRAVLQDLSFDIPSGAKVALVGRSGSGKSSLLLAIARLLPLSAGRIILDGIDLANLSPSAVRNAITVIPQDPLLLPGSVTYNLDPTGALSSPTMANDTPEGAGAVDPQANLLIIDSLRKVGLWDTVSAHGGLSADMRTLPLSQGQKQLFCLARAILRNKALERNCGGIRGGLVLLDEATSAVDANTARRMMELVKTEFAGKTVIAVTHHAEEAKEFGIVVEMAGGRIVKVERRMEKGARVE